MSVAVVMLALSLGLILLASILFTNGIELAGKRLNMHQGATGSILAAVGTALPETIIPIIAILFFANPDAANVGIGAIAGAPFMLATLGFFVTGGGILFYSFMGRRSTQMHIEPHVVVRDLTYFVLVYSVAVAVTALSYLSPAMVVTIRSHHVNYFPIKLVAALGLAVSYIFYVRRTLASECAEVEEVETLYVHRFLGVGETTPWMVVQVVGSLVLMVFSGHLFVGYVEQVATKLGISSLMLSIVITPVATELPEKCNSVLWVRNKKDILAFGNMTGAMVFQSSFPVIVGILFTEWKISGATLASAVIALLSAVIVLAWVKLRGTLSPWLLALGVVYYGIFLTYLVVFHA
jgi:cation:H+ antiporter